MGPGPREGVQVHPSAERTGIQMHDDYPTQCALSNSAREILAGSGYSMEQNATIPNDVHEVREQLEGVKEAGEEDGSVESPPKSCCARFLGAILCIFPKVEPLPWGQFVILTAWCAIP